MIKKSLLAIFKNNQRNWTEKADFEESWKKRIALMASYIDVSGTVADFGCGMMWLEGNLKKGNDYLPIDFVQRDTRTIVMNFNSNFLPPIKADIAFLSGVLEYVKDVKDFAKYLTNLNFKKIIFSYCTIENIPNQKNRRKLNWVSNESIFSLLKMFCKSYDLVDVNYIDKNTIFVLNKRLL
jgi:hypothetical protein